MSVHLAPLDSLSPAQIGVITERWKREGREIEASFGGVSMLPTIAPGAPLRIHCGASADPGDVVLFRYRGEIVVHRLLARRGKWMLTRGDANAVPDQPIASERLIGRVTAMQRGGIWEEVAWYEETREQRRIRAIVSALLVAGATPAGMVIPVLWQFRRLREAWRRLGTTGVAARLWAKSGGALLDIDLLSTLRLSTAMEFVPKEGFRYERVGLDSPLFAAAARLLGVDPKKRAEQEAFVVVTPDSSVAACSFNDRSIVDGAAHQRGVAVDARFRGRGLGTSVLRYQAHELGSEGAAAIEVHVGATNRASRRMFASLGARRTERWIIVTLLRRFRFARRRAVGVSQ